MKNQIEAVIKSVEVEITKVGTNHDRGYRLGRARSYLESALKAVEKAEVVIA